MGYRKVTIRVVNTNAVECDLCGRLGPVSLRDPEGAAAVREHGITKFGMHGKHACWACRAEMVALETKPEIAKGEAKR